ncbi:hypothetical protein GSI_08479 [Ganoderma sinense ZZ0214-1]|uniref:Uncharacterized protein n=1 Tax=Ganoderma sinense ZZ0214-1 TaxID=1077348 RepID=A0A2G8S3X9_9APHY|nr:hypothetical protein GSI_08479 [Ganoderma sinense ZZ0214-1]
MYQSATVPERLLLWVYTNPARGTAYYKWHEAERVPALRDHMPPSTVFLACSRWVAADGAAPAYLSLYDLARGSAASAVHDPAYVALSEKHALETRAAAFVESRVYEPVVPPSPLALPTPPWTWTWSWNWMDGNGSEGTDESEDSGSDEERRRPQTRYISVIEADLHAFAEGEFCRWYDEEHILLLARVPGWVRSRRYVLKEKLEVGASDSDSDSERGLGGVGVGVATDTDAEMETATGSEGGNGDGSREEEEEKGRERENSKPKPGGREMEFEEHGADRPPKFLAIHEWASLDAFETKQYRRATNTPWRTEVLKEGRVLRYEIRVFRAA